ncbi:hypothetical protein ACLBX9_13270 [Methylobacterium sp. A49B]|nr:hypothetical protein [Parafilimonas terrae]
MTSPGRERPRMTVCGRCIRDEPAARILGGMIYRTGVGRVARIDPDWIKQRPRYVPLTHTGQRGTLMRIRYLLPLVGLLALTACKDEKKADAPAPPPPPASTAPANPAPPPTTTNPAPANKP